MADSNSSPDHSNLHQAFSSLLFANLRTHLTKRRFQLDDCLGALQSALRLALTTNDAWVLVTQPPQEGRDSASISFHAAHRSPPGRPPAELLGRPIMRSDAFNRFWIFPIPSYLASERTFSCSEFALVVRKTPQLIRQPGIPAFLSFAATAIGNAIAISHDYAASHDSHRLLVLNSLKRRSADDYLAYGVLKLCKSLLQDWKCLSLWRVSRTQRVFEKIAEERIDALPMQRDDFQLSEYPLLGLSEVCAIATDVSHIDRLRRVVSYCSDDHDVLSHNCVFVVNGAPVDAFLLAEGDGIHQDRIGLARFCVRLATSYPLSQGDALLVFLFASDVMREPIQGRLIASDPDAATLDRSSPPSFFGALAVHVRNPPRLLAPLRYLWQVLSHCAATFDGFSQVRMLLFQLTEAIRLMEDVATFRELCQLCERITSDILRGTAVVVWRVSPLRTPPIFVSSELEGADLDATSDEVSYDRKAPWFFGSLDAADPRWLHNVSAQLLKGVKSASVRDAAPLYSSVSGFVLPMQVGRESYVFAFLRARKSRQLSFEMACCRILHPILAGTLQRIMQESSSVAVNRVISRPSPSTRSDVFSVLCGDVKTGCRADAVLFLQRDEGSDLLSLKYHAGTVAVAAANTAVIPTVAPSLATLSISERSALFGRVQGKRVKPFYLSSSGDMRSIGGDVPFLGWVGTAACAIAWPVVIGDDVMGVLVVGWSSELTDSARQAAVRTVRELADRAQDAFKAQMIHLQWTLNEGTRPLLEALDTVTAPSALPGHSPSRNLLPELGYVFTDEFVTALSALLEKARDLLSCHSVTLRASNWHRDTLQAIASVGRASRIPQLSLDTVSSVSAYCFIHFKDFGAISVPRVDPAKGTPVAVGRYDGLCYADGGRGTRSELCFPLLDLRGTCFGTVNLESEREDAFWLPVPAKEGTSFPGGGHPVSWLRSEGRGVSRRP